MGSINDPATLLASLNDYDSLVLEQIQLGKRIIHFLELVGDGSAGYVFRVRYADKEYALKIFKSARPAFGSPREAVRRACYDPFFIECRANGSLIAEGWNGKFSPFCHGWLNIPQEVERYMYRKFRLHQFDWDRPDDAPDEELRAMLFDYIDGKKLYETPLTPNIANQIRQIVGDLHGIGISHSDIAAPNFLVQGDDEQQKVFILDFSDSFTLPHVLMTNRKWKRRLELDLYTIEIGFKLLSELPINENLPALADEKAFDKLTPDQIASGCDFSRIRWHRYELYMVNCCGRCPHSLNRITT